MCSRSSTRSPHTARLGSAWRAMPEREIVASVAYVENTSGRVEPTRRLLSSAAAAAGQAVAALRLVAAAVGRAAEARRRGKLGRCQ